MSSKIITLIGLSLVALALMACNFQNSAPPISVASETGTKAVPTASVQVASDNAKIAELEAQLADQKYM